MRQTVDARNRDVDAPDSQADKSAFLASVLRNEFIAEILERTRGTDLPEWYLSGGCLFQTVWNIEHGFEPSTGILDYDLFYFGDADLSQRAERAIGEEIARTFAHLPVKMEVSNQARVHLWYEDEFRAPCRAFECCEDGIDAFLAICCCFGVRDTGETLKVYAPHGFDDLFGLVVRPNPARASESSVLSNVYRAKVERWSEVWPRLTIVPWPAGSGEPQ